MSIPTYSLFVVAPLNVLFNYLFVGLPLFFEGLSLSYRFGDLNLSDLDSPVEL